MYRQTHVRHTNQNLVPEDLTYPVWSNMKKSSPYTHRPPNSLCKSTRSVIVFNLPFSGTTGIIDPSKFLFMYSWTKAKKWGCLRPFNDLFFFFTFRYIRHDTGNLLILKFTPVVLHEGFTLQVSDLKLQIVTWRGLVPAEYDNNLVVDSEGVVQEDGER